MRVSDILRAQRDAVVTEWAQEARREVPRAADVPMPALLDHVPDLLVALAAWLDAKGDGDAADAWRRNVRSHAIDRLERDFDLSHVVREYQLLRRVLGRQLTRSGPNAPRELQRVDEALDVIVTEAVARFSEERERRVMAEAARSRLALQAAAIGMWDWEAPSWDFRCDARARELLGLASELRDAVVRYDTFLGALHADDRARVKGALEQKRQSGAEGDDYRIEFRAVGIQDRVERWLEARGRVVARSSNGGAERFIGTVLEVTERKRVEHELAQAAAFRERFVGIVGHDLRNPLSTITTAAHILKASGQVPPAMIHNVERISSNADRMARMIGDLLDLTHGRLGGGIPIEREPTDLHALAPAVSHDLELAHPGRRVEIEMRGALDGEWDADRVAQALGNLVSNAFTHGDPTAPVHVSISDLGDRVELAVHNVGSPIPPDLHDHLFDPFRRGRLDGKGLGLGLFITSEIARAHGGRIGVVSNEREGTTFRMELPRCAPSSERGQKAGG